MDSEKLLEKYKMPLIIGLGGVILAGLGVFGFLFSQQERTKIEILPAEETAATMKIWVDIQGAVEKPGVYELTADSRLNDLLIMAGGLSAKADREWVSKNINLAQKLKDGIKIYFPITGGEVSGQAVNEAITSLTSAKININTASSRQLDTLWGIGEARAEAIISNRPYQNLEELMTKAGIPQNVYERLEDKVTLY